MWRIAVVLIAVARVAAAEGLEEQRNGGFTVTSPEELQTYDAVVMPALDRAISEAKDPLERATLVLRRADSEASRGVYERVLMNRELLEMRVGIDDARRNELVKLSAKRQTESTVAFNHAIDDYTQLFCATKVALATCSHVHALYGWPPLDGALFRFGYVLRLSSRPEDMAIVYRRLVSDHPKSKHVLDARLQLGDRLYQKADYPAAHVEFEILSRATLPPAFHLYALQMRAALELNLKQYKDSFEHYSEALALDPQNPQVSQFRSNLVNAYRSIGNARDALTDLERASPGHGLELATILGARWGHTPSTLALHKELLRRAPDNVAACQWQVMVVQNVRNNHQAEFALQFEEVERLVAVMERAVALNLADEAVTRCRAVTRQNTLNLARNFVYQAKQKPGGEEGVFARRLFELFVRAFPEDKEVATAYAERSRVE